MYVGVNAFFVYLYKTINQCWLSGKGYWVNRVVAVIELISWFILCMSMSRDSDYLFIYGYFIPAFA